MSVGISKGKQNVALVHDWLTNMGGAENVIEALLDIYPEAPIFTSLFEPKKLSKKLQSANVYPSYLQRLPKFLRKQQLLLPLMPKAFEEFDLSDYEIVISSSSSCAKGIITGERTIHVCYCHTPMRYAWDFYHEYMGTLSQPKKFLATRQIHKIRQWDRLSADRVDYFIANSSAVARRINKHYRREAIVIHPPVAVDRFRSDHQKEDFYLVVSRLVSYKHIELAVQACTQLNRKLVVIGDGEQAKELKKLGGKSITFLGRQSDEVVAEYFSRARAFLFPGEEDFGITIVEAQAAGCPVIAYGKGGAQDSVLEGVTGIFFTEQTIKGLSEAILTFEKMQLDPAVIRQHSLRFSEKQFKEKIKNFVENL